MNVLLFGPIAELAQTDAIRTSASSVEELRKDLEARIGGLARMSYAIAVDRVIVHEDRALNGNEEVAFLPPFAGG